MITKPQLSTTHTHGVIRKNGFIQKLDDMTACGEIIQHENQSHHRNERLLANGRSRGQQRWATITGDAPQPRVHMGPVDHRVRTGRELGQTGIKRGTHLPLLPESNRIRPGQIWGQPYQMVGRGSRASISDGCDSATQQVKKRMEDPRTSGGSPRAGPEQLPAGWRTQHIWGGPMRSTARASTRELSGLADVSKRKRIGR